MKLLNLDDLIANKRSVQIHGVEYPVAEQSLGGLIEAIKREKLMDRSDDVALFENMLTSAATLLPTVPENILRSLSIRQLTAVVNFAAASDDQLEDSAAAEGDEAGK